MSTTDRSTSVVIDAAAEHTHLMLSDPCTLWAREQTVSACRQRVGNGPGPGAIYTLTVRSALGPRTHEYRITDWDWPRSATLVPDSRTLPVVTIHVTATDTGSVATVRYTYSRRPRRRLDIARLDLGHLVVSPLSPRWK